MGTLVHLISFSVCHLVSQYVQHVHLQVQPPEQSCIAGNPRGVAEPSWLSCLHGHFPSPPRPAGRQAEWMEPQGRGAGCFLQNKPSRRCAVNEGSQGATNKRRSNSKLLLEVTGTDGLFLGNPLGNPRRSKVKHKVSWGRGRNGQSLMAKCAKVLCHLASLN